MKRQFFLLMLKSLGTNPTMTVSFLTRPAGTSRESVAEDLSIVGEITDIMELEPADVMEEETFAELDEILSEMDPKRIRDLQWIISTIANRAAVYGTLRFEQALTKKD